MHIKIKRSLAAPLLALIMYILLAASNFINIAEVSQTDNVFLAVIILQIVIFIIPGIIYCKLRGSELTPSLRLRSFGPRKLWFSVSSFLALLFGSSLIKLGLYALGYYSSQYTLYEDYLPTNAGSLKNVLYIIIAIAIIPAITEEFVFRGIVLGEYTGMGCKKTSAIVLSALLFSMMHFNAYQLPVYFFGGVVLGYVTLVSGSVLCAMLVHMLNNAFSLLFEPQLLRLITQTDSLIFVLFVLAILFMVFLILTFQGAERIYYVMGINGEDSPPRRKRRTKEQKISIDLEALISPTFILCVIAFFVMTFALK